MFGSTRVNTLATPRLGAIRDATGPGMVDGEGAGAASWLVVASMVADGVSIPLVIALAATSTTFDDG